MRSPKIVSSLVVLILALSGCASGPVTQFANPDSNELRYSAGESKMLAHTSPEPRSIGVRENDRENVYEIMGFRKFSFDPEPVIPDSHLIGVKVFDPNIENGRLVIPLQNLERLESKGGVWVAHHTIDGLSSPLEVDLILNEGDRSAYGYGKKQDFLFRHYTPEGDFAGFVYVFAVNDDPTAETVNPGNQIHLQVSTNQDRWTFMTGETLQQELAETKRIREKQLAESEEMRKRTERSLQKIEREVAAAFSAPKPVGQMVCTKSGWIGVVEQNEGSRIKMSVIGRSGIRGDFPFSDTASGNRNLRFDIDTTHEGEMRWMDSRDLGICDYEIIRN